MMVFLNAGGLQGGGVNFDAKIRRNSTDLEDLFHAHIGGADTFARGIMVADKVLNDPAFSSIVNGRYSSFDSANGFAFEQGKLSLCDLFDVATRNTDAIKPRSGKQEYLENILNNHV
jgi:xylose isomerase